MNRRNLLALLAGTAVTAAVSARARAQAVTLAAAEIAPGLAVVRGAGANVLAAVRGDSLLVVDSGAPEHAAALIAHLRERYEGRPISLLFNTNWRPEHTGGNAPFAEAGAKILAHANTKLYLAGDFFVEWEDRHYTPRPKAAWPTDTFYTSGKTELGGTTVEYHHFPRAHTDGDVAVFFPDANVWAVSDLLAVDRYPLFDYETGGWIGGFEDATKRLLELSDADSIIVPAEGPPQKRAALEAQLALCTAVRERVAQAFRSGSSFEDFAATAPTKDFDARRGDPRLFLQLVYKGAFAHIRELGGVI